MRKAMILIVLIIGVLALAIRPALAANYEVEPNNAFQVLEGKFNGHNQDFIDQEWKRGDDYTFLWTEQGYSAWAADNSGNNAWTATSMWGGWFWAAQFVAPCAQWQKVNNNPYDSIPDGTPDYYGGTCPEWTSKVSTTDYHMSDNPQTAWGLDTSVDGTIIDDLYSRVVDNWLFATDPPGGIQTWRGILDQDLDILFGRYSNDMNGTALDHKYVFYPADEPEDAHTTTTIVDEAIDQQFAYWNDSMGSTEGMLEANSENGITQRLVAEFGLTLFANTDPTGAEDAKIWIGGNTNRLVNSASAGIYLHEAKGIDQWVVQWLRDIVTVPVDGFSAAGTYVPLGGGKKGIDQYYSSWFGDDADYEPTCAKCSWTYKLEHPTVTKEVQKSTHDHNPNDGATYQSTSPGLQWDP